MSTSASTIDFLLDQLSGLADVHARKMFGEYALYRGDKVVALVCDNQLFVKITPPGKAVVGVDYQEGYREGDLREHAATAQGRVP